MLLVTTPTDISPLGTDVVSRPALVLLIKIARHTSVTTVRGLRKDKVCYSPFWRVPGTAEATQQGLTERESSDLGLCLYWGEGGVPRVLHVLSLLVNLTDKRESVEGKRKPLKWSSRTF